MGKSTRVVGWTVSSTARQAIRRRKALYGLEFGETVTVLNGSKTEINKLLELEKEMSLISQYIAS
jgi:hypothetical protein